MTTEQLSVWLQDDAGFCGCGDPVGAAERMLDLLDCHPLYEHQAELHALVSDEGVQMLLLYWFDGLGLTEHGTSVGGAWLTERGREIRDALRLERERDRFETLLDQRCIHGHLITDVEHDCGAAEAGAAVV